MGRGIAVGSGTTRHAVGITIAVVSLAACGDSRQSGDAGADDASGPGSGEVGAACTSSRACDDGACIDVGLDSKVCSAECASDDECPPGWSCDSGQCDCSAWYESCDGEDDDCDGVVDEAEPSAGCARTQRCEAGECVCRAMCDGECVDTRADRRHCGECGNACPSDQACVDGVCCVAGGSSVDLLFMVDNTNSMAEEQAALAETFPRLVRGLANGEITDPDTGEAVRTFTPVDDLNVGVVSSDMGTGGFTVPTCDEARTGDDGVLQSEGNTTLSGCMADYPKFLNFMPGDDVAMFAQDFTCIARIGTGGCGFQQPLEAVLKATLPGDADIIGDGLDQIDPFLTGGGHAAGANSGFVRPGSVLGVVLLTDADDCSATDTEVYYPDSTRYEGDLDLRCFMYPEALHSVRRYSKGLSWLRRDAPSRLVFAPIVGVPTDLHGTDFAVMLDDPRMQEQIDADEPTRLEPSCTTPETGAASPPRRIVATAQQLESRGARVTVESICQPDLTPAVPPILQRLADAASARCR